MPCLEVLSSDKVTVVRVVLARFLAHLPEAVRNSLAIKTLSDKLSKDENTDVVEALT